MVATIISGFCLFIMGLCIYTFYERWKYEQAEKKRWREKEAKRPKAKLPVRKMEYDCTENFYHD